MYFQTICPILFFTVTKPGLCGIFHYSLSANPSAAVQLNVNYAVLRRLVCATSDNRFKNSGNLLRYVERCKLTKTKFQGLLPILTKNN